MASQAIVVCAVTFAAAALWMVFPGTVAAAVDLIAFGLLVALFRKIPVELRQRLLRELRLETLFCGFFCTGLLAMAAFERFIPDQLHRPVGLFWLAVTLAFLGLLVVRIVRFVMAGLKRSRA